MIRPGQGYGPLGLFRDRRWEALSATQLATWALGLVGLAMLAALVGFLCVESGPFLAERGAGFLADPMWSAPHRRFGALAMIHGTLGVAAVALLLAGPLGLLAAVALAELVPGRWRAPFKVAVDLLAGVPSVVYGLLGIALLRGPIQDAGLASGDSLLTAGLVLAVMVLPTILSLADEALRAVGRPYRDAATALGLTRTETILFGVVRPALPGLAAALLLALGRALGETVAVYLLVGRSDGRGPTISTFLETFREPGQTLTSKLGGPEPFLAHSDPLHWSAIVSLALVLFAITFAISQAGQLLLPREAR